MSKKVYLCWRCKKRAIKDPSISPLCYACSTYVPEDISKKKSLSRWSKAIDKIRKEREKEEHMFFWIIPFGILILIMITLKCT